MPETIRTPKATGREKERHEAAARLQGRPAGAIVLPADGELGKVIVAFHAQMRELLQRR